MFNRQPRRFCKPGGVGSVPARFGSQLPCEASDIAGLQGEDGSSDDHRRSLGEVHSPAPSRRTQSLSGSGGRPLLVHDAMRVGLATDWEGFVRVPDPRARFTAKKEGGGDRQASSFTTAISRHASTPARIATCTFPNPEVTVSSPKQRLTPPSPLPTPHVALRGSHRCPPDVRARTSGAWRSWHMRMDRGAVGVGSRLGCPPHRITDVIRSFCHF